MLHPERLVYFGNTKSNAIVNFVKGTTKIVVCLIPRQKFYNHYIKQCLQLGNFRLYEISNGRVNVLRARAKAYCTTKPKSQIVESL